MTLLLVCPLRCRRAIFAAALAIGLFGASPASAVSQRTFVATYGNDASASCSPVAPCRSFGAAIARTAPGGEVVVLDSGGYGPVEITHSVAIVAPRGIYAGISVLPGLSGITINGGGVHVTLRGLAISGQPGSNAGIDVQSAARVRIDRCSTTNLDIGIRNVSGANVVVTDAVSSGNVSFGLRTGAGSTTVGRSQFAGNGSGLSLGGTGYSDVGTLTVIDSLVVANIGEGAGVRVGGMQQYRLVADRLTSRGNLGAGAASGIEALFPIHAYGTTGRAWIFDSTLDGNGDGARVESELPNNVSLLSMSGNRVTNNGAHGVLATTPGSFAGAQASAYVSRNVFAGNGVGLGTNELGTVYTRGNNEVPGPSPVQGNVVLQAAAYY